MNRAALSVCVASIYLVVLGCGLVFVPNLILVAFRLPTTDEVWVHMLGMTTIFLGISQYQVVLVSGSWLSGAAPSVRDLYRSTLPDDDHLDLPGIFELVLYLTRDLV